MSKSNWSRRELGKSVILEIKRKHFVKDGVVSGAKGAQSFSKTWLWCRGCIGVLYPIFRPYRVLSELQSLVS